MANRILNLFTVLVMAVSLVGVLPAVDAAAETYSGSCGDNVTWSLDTESGVLTISGTGDMDSYVNTMGGGEGYVPHLWGSTAPWSNYPIKQVKIEQGVTSIGNAAFTACDFTNITMPDSIKKIGEYAFTCCSRLTDISIPSNVENIEFGAFAYCENLTNIIIPGNVENIGNGAFCYCKNLTEVTMLDGVKSIGERAFESYIDVTNLTNVTIPNSVTSIGAGAFNYCSSLKSILIPKIVKEIGEQAFGYYYDMDIYGAKKISNFKIYCYADTAGEQYAKDNGFDYEILSDTGIDPSVPSTPSDPSNPSDNPSNPSDSSNPSGSGQSQPSNSGSSQPTSAQPATNAPTTAAPKVTPPTATTVVKPAKVKAVKLTAKGKKLNVKWKKVSGATGYEVKVATNGKFTKGKKTVTVKKNKVTLKNLKPKKKYFVKVRAYKLANGRKFYGKWSKVVKKKVK